MNNPNIIEKELSYRVMGILFRAHSALGGEYQEKYYQRAIAKAFKKEKIKCEEQIEVDLEFNEEKIGKYYLDFLIEDKIILEIKAIPRLKPIYFRQVRAYLKAKNLELGILANFRGAKLTYKRILYPIRTKNSDNSHSDKFVWLALHAINHYLKTNSPPEIPPNLPKKFLTDQAGIFVSLHNKRNENLRGCIGTSSPVRANIAQEIIVNAIAAATQDPRFPPVTEKDLDDLEISVDILSEPKAIKNTSEVPMGVAQSGRGGRLLNRKFGIQAQKSLADSEFRREKRRPCRPPPRWKDTLNPKKYGLIVSTADGRKGLLLPNIPGVETSEQQIAICRRKAGISANEPIKLETFTVERHTER